MNFFCKNYRFEVFEDNSVILFWQPYEATGDVEARLELILEHDGLQVDSHVYISPNKEFNSEVNYITQKKP